MQASILLIVLCGQMTDPAPSQGTDSNGFKSRGAPAVKIGIDPVQIDGGPDTGKVIRAANTTRSAPTATQDAAQLLSGLLAIPSKSQISGNEKSLLELVRLKQGLAEQRKIVGEYWKLSKAVAHYHRRLRSYDFLAQLTPPASPTEQSALTAEVATAKAEVGRARLNVMRAQMALAEMVDSDADELSLPRDKPLVGRYLTKFDELYASRRAPRRIRNIDRLLPQLYKSVREYAAAIQTANNAAKMNLTAYQAKKGALADVLRYHRQLDRNRQQFLEAVYSYNTNIADYALAVAPTSSTADVVVSMLIKTKKTIRPSAVFRRNRVQHASNEEPLHRSVQREPSGWRKRR